MRRIVRAVAVVVLAAGVVCGPASSGQTARAQLHLAGLMLQGTGFQAREHIRLVVRAPALGTRRVTAGSGGGFTMRFNLAAGTACTGLTIVATGDQGSKATLTRLPQQCGAIP